jgi:AcrR family transcriptional regulator
VLTATVALLDEPTVGLSRLTIEGIAQRAGVSKATIYRWWGSKTDLVVEAYLAKAARDAPVPETGSVRQDLVELLGRLAFALTRLGSGRTMTDFVVEAHSNSSFGDLFRSTLLASRRRAMEEVLERGRRRGEIRQGVQLTVIIDTLYGAMYHRLLMSRETIDGEFVRSLVDTVIDGVAAN